MMPGLNVSLVPVLLIIEVVPLVTFSISFKRSISYGSSPGLVASLLISFMITYLPESKDKSIICLRY